MKKVLSLALVLAMLCVVFGAYAEEEVVEWPELKSVDFGGATIYVWDYWSSANWDEIADPTEEQQATLDYRAWLCENFNCEVNTVAIGEWGSNVTELVNFCGSEKGDKLALFILPPDFVGGPMGNGQLAGWAGDLVDMTAAHWNQATVNFMTVNGTIYGVSTGHSEPRQCLYFNKRVLEEADIDWNTIYDMQADGTWTFEAFEELLKKIQKDTDNDGAIDVYGIVGSNVDMYRVAVFANGGKFFDFDADGNMVIAAGSDNTMEALAWAKDIWANYAYAPADANWDYYKDAWKQGFCGFYMYQTYGGFNDNSEMADMADEWGCVAFPTGPKGEAGKYVTIVSDNVTVIPNVYDAETAGKLAYFYQMWTAPTPGYDADNWIGNKYLYTDERAVDETYAMLREADHCASDIVLYLGSVNDVEGQDYLWNLSWQTPAEMLEAKQGAWQGLLDAFNAK